MDAQGTSADPVSPRMLEEAPQATGGAATTGTGRVGNVDVLRAAAALGVLIGHAYALGGRVLPVKADHWYDVPIISTATGVWLFFGISGYVISRPFIDCLATGRPLPDFVPYALRRTLRIFPLYWICLTVTILVAGAAGTRAWQFPIHYALLQNLVPGRQEALLSVAWTLTLEVLFYIAVPLLALAARRALRAPSAEHVACLVVLSWLGSILFTVFSDLQGAGRVGLWLRGSFPATWQMFCPGILLALAPHIRAPQWRRWLVELPESRAAYVATPTLLVAGAVLGAVAPLRFGVVGYQLIGDTTRPMFAVGYGLVIAFAMRARPVRARWILHLGLASYGIYLLHAVLLEFFTYAVHIVFLAALTVPLAMASWRWFERPLIGFAGTLGRRWTAAHGQERTSTRVAVDPAAQGAGRSDTG